MSKNDQDNAPEHSRSEPDHDPPAEADASLGEPPTEDEGNGGARPRPRPKTALESFKFAFDGIVDVFRSQKHMRFHFVTVVIVLLGALFLQIGKQDIVILLFTISLVLMAEMFNTAIETVVDMVTETYHPLAKVAKDAAAGAVLIATTTAVLIGFLILATSFGGFGETNWEPQTDWIRFVVTALVLTVLVVIIKALGARGKLLRGGLVSGHTVAGMFIAFVILVISRNAVTAILAVMLALLIAQSRVQAKIHSIQEVIVGALLALVVTAGVYWLLPAVARVFGW